MAETLSRRRAICILAAAGGLTLLPWSRAAAAAPSPVVWNGQALGAPASLVLHHPDRRQAEKLITRMVAEVARLETIFSLYREDSALNELNRLGALAMPPAELVAVLDASRTVWEATGGLFDPSVQPLWSLYARHFGEPGADPSGPPEAEAEKARRLVGLRNIHANRDRIAFARSGMALTLNGIAQGYITDRIVALLRDAGVTSSLVDMGETRAIGNRADGSPWSIGLAETQSDDIDTVIPIVDKAVATSSLMGFRFDAAGRFGHILHPMRGRVEPRYRRLTVIATEATRADAYSTAMTLMSPEEIRTAVARQPGLSVDLVTVSGQHLRFG
nr:FAD:protein FMN transferase [Rhizobium sp. Q54]